MNFDMAHYISADHLRAEIEIKKKTEGWCEVGKDTADIYYARGVRFTCDFVLNLIDSLHQEMWKPSEEQMKALQNAVALAAGNKVLAGLYEHLKKLM